MTKEQEDALFSIQDIVRLTKLLPLTLSQEIMNDNRKQLLVIDINTIPSEMKDEAQEIGALRDAYKEMYPNYDFLFINTSRQNTEGNVATSPPVYVI